MLFQDSIQIAWAAIMNFMFLNGFDSILLIDENFHHNEFNVRVVEWIKIWVKMVEPKNKTKTSLEISKSVIHAVHLVFSVCQITLHIVILMRPIDCGNPVSEVADQNANHHDCQWPAKKRSIPIPSQLLALIFGSSVFDFEFVTQFKIESYRLLKYVAVWNCLVKITHLFFNLKFQLLFSHLAFPETIAKWKFFDSNNQITFNSISKICYIKSLIFKSKYDQT